MSLRVTAIAPGQEAVLLTEDAKFPNSLYGIVGPYDESNQLILHARNLNDKYALKIFVKFETHTDFIEIGQMTYDSPSVTLFLPPRGSNPECLQVYVKSFYIHEPMEVEEEEQPKFFKALELMNVKSDESCWTCELFTYGLDTQFMKMKLENDQMILESSIHYIDKTGAVEGICKKMMIFPRQFVAGSIKVMHGPSSSTITVNKAEEQSKK